jgi:hypothetical protein
MKGCDFINHYAFKVGPYMGGKMGKGNEHNEKNMP